MAVVRRLFTKVVFVATGSGIGPTLPHLLTKEAPSRLVWVTKDPRLTYGDALVNEIMDAQPDALIWNTDQRGKPDILRLAYAAYLDSKAEAVVCISNSTVTGQVVYGLERRGIPAFGPIFDSNSTPLRISRKHCLTGSRVLSAGLGGGRERSRHSKVFQGGGLPGAPGPVLAHAPASVRGSGACVPAPRASASVRGKMVRMGRTWHPRSLPPALRVDPGEGEEVDHRNRRGRARECRLPARVVGEVGLGVALEQADDDLGDDAAADRVRGGGRPRSAPPP